MIPRERFRRRPLRAALAAFLGMLALAAGAFAQDDFIDRVDDQLSFGAWNDQLRARVSGTFDLEGYAFTQPGPDLLYSQSDDSLAPRLSLFLDVQAGQYLYGFVQVRADTGFDPGESGPDMRLDEYAVRFTPWAEGYLNLQVGKFATVVGTWTARHDSWDNPFITAPLAYDYLTGIWDTTAAHSADQIQFWAGISPPPTEGGRLLDHYRNLPILWGPSYGSGASVFGAFGTVTYAFEIKNTSLSGRPDTWSPADTQWQEPTYSGRLGYVPNEMWSFGVSASSGPYLQPEAAATFLPGESLGQYTETVLGQDVSFAWHRLQVWAEVFEAGFRIPGVGTANTQSYYIETKYKFTPQFYGSLRWNQQLFSSLANAAGVQVPWSRNVWRLDVGPAYRFTPHTQLKLQFSLEYQQAATRNWGNLAAFQFTTRF